MSNFSYIEKFFSSQNLLPQSNRAVLIGLGSNMGNSQQLLGQAEQALHKILGNVFCSTVYRSPAMYVTAQPDFLNQTICGMSEIPPHDLLLALQNIEKTLGRVRRHHHGPREIDLDILLVGKDHIMSNDLQVPHPLLCERAFVLYPACEIVPDWQHPLTGQTLRELAKLCPDQGCVRKATLL